MAIKKVSKHNEFRFVFKNFTPNDHNEMHIDRNEIHHVCRIRIICIMKENRYVNLKSNFA